MAVTSFNRNVLVNKLIYNGGRIFTYSLLGGLVSLVGVMIDFSHFQFALTLALAVTLILMGFSGISGMQIPVVTPLLTKFTLWLKARFGELLKKRSLPTMWLTGMLNGILPCGLTYLALTYCLTLAGPLDGFQFMFLFGAGTLPAMVGLTGVIGWLVKRHHVNIGLITRYSFIVLGGIVLVRLFFSQHHVVSGLSDQVGIIFCR
jgi:sulfite exporter TauE/SafE